MHLLTGDNLNDCFRLSLKNTIRVIRDAYSWGLQPSSRTSPQCIKKSNGVGGIPTPLWRCSWRLNNFYPRPMCMANPNLKDKRYCFISYSQEEVGKYHLNDEYYNRFNFKSWPTGFIRKEQFETPWLKELKTQK